MTANPGMDYAYFSITPWLQTKLIDAGDGKYEIVIIVRLTPHYEYPAILPYTWSCSPLRTVRCVLSIR